MGNMLRCVAVLLCLSLLTACGFKLRGAYSLPFDTIAISLPDTSELRAIIKRNITASSKTRVVDDPKDAQAILTVVGDRVAKNILSLNSSGRVSEYQLVRTFSFRVHDMDGRDFIPQSDIVMRRDITYSDAQVLSKESEETLLLRDMQNDLVQQLMRRLSLAKVPGKDATADATAR